MKSLKIEVVIVTNNGSKWIDTCLKSLLNSSIAVSIIVVDNCSSDSTIELIKANFQDVSLLQQKENLGFGKANNIGISLAMKKGADYVFLLNQDAWVEDKTLEKLVQAHQKEQVFGIVSPMHLNGKGDALDYNFSKFIEPSKCKKLYSDIYLNTVQDKIYNAEFVNAAAWLISKKCIDTVGGFNPSFFHYAEDNNYIQRLKFHNINVGVVPNAIIFHDRAKRVENIFFEDIKIIYRREIISKISDPFVEYSFYAEYWKICRTIIKSFFSLSINELKVSCSKIIILNGLNKSQVVKNRIESKKVQPSFLE